MGAHHWRLGKSRRDVYCERVSLELFFLFSRCPRAKKTDHMADEDEREEQEDQVRAENDE